MAEKVGTPVYELERNMPARELAEWIHVLREQAGQADAPSIDEMNPAAFAAAMGAEIISDGK